MPRFALPLVRTRQAMLDDKIPDHEIRAALADGSLVRVRRGSYVPGPLDRDPRAVALARVAAVAAQHEAPMVFSHATAAVLWDLPFIGQLPTTTHLTAPPSMHGARRSGVHVHNADLDPSEIVHDRGIALTSLARTLVDVACTDGFRAGVVMADHALRLAREPGALRREMQSAIDRSVRCVGIGQARRMAAFAVTQAESPGESLSRIVFAEQGVPTPVLQYPMRLRTARFTGEIRTDMAWEEQKTVGEFDGMAKYQRDLDPGETPGDVLEREKLREDAIRRAGWAVIRWTWEELWAPARLGRRVREVLAARR